MKPILQPEAAECGLASLAMVVSTHGLHVGLPELRRRFPLSLKGAKLSHLIRIAQQLGFSTRPLRLDMEDLGKLKLPCILHWDLNHFVVLAKVGRSKVTILDPAIGERVLSLAEVSEHFTGVALELSPSAGFKPQKAVPAITARQFGAVTLVAGAREVYLDATGLYLAGAPAGLTGVDAISLSMANRAAARPS